MFNILEPQNYIRTPKPLDQISSGCTEIKKNLTNINKTDAF